MMSLSLLVKLPSPREADEQRLRAGALLLEDAGMKNCQ